VVALPADTTSHSLGCALSLLRMTPAQCAFLGRAPREARDAASHGIASAATTHGRIARSALRKAGARLVVQDLRALAGGLERLLRVLSPGSLRWDEAVLTRFMREALQMAEQNLAQCRAPHGAVVATGAGVLVGRGRDLSDTHGALAHAEMEAMRMAQAHLRPGEGAILATTAAPCAMCLSAAAECGIDMVLYGTRGEQRRPSHRIGAAQDRKAASPRILGGILAEQCASLLARFRAADESGSHIRRESGLLTRHAAVNPAQRATK
jgi:tRNA(Arg) A34 adenosine deaminase TadA